jgi:hypothetical protein
MQYKNHSSAQLKAEAKTQPFLMRLRPSTRALLDKACVEQGRSRSSIVDQVLNETLTPLHGNLEARLRRFLHGRGKS